MVEKDSGGPQPLSIFCDETSGIKSELYRVQLTIDRHCFRQWLGVYLTPHHYLDQWRPNSPTHISAIDLNAPEFSWWLHQMETFSALLALCARNSLVNMDSVCNKSHHMGDGYSIDTGHIGIIFKIFFSQVWHLCAKVSHTLPFYRAW